MSSPHKFYPNDPAYNLSTHLAHVQGLHAKYHYNNERACNQLARQYEHSALIWELLAAEGIFAPTKPTTQAQSHLTYLQAVFTGTHAAAAAKMIDDILPELPKEKSHLTVPLHSMLDVPDFIIQVHRLAASQIDGLPIFPKLRDRLGNNIIMASGYDPSTYTNKPLTMPHESDLEGSDLVEAYLVGTLFDEFLEEQVPFVIPRKTWASHAIVLAPPNHGKTQLLGSIISGFLAGVSDNPGLFVLDPHGDLFATLSLRVSSDRLVILDPDTNPPPLNFLDFGTSTEAQTLQTFSYLMSSLSGGLSDKQGAIVPYLLKLLRKIPDASLETLRQIVDEKCKNPSQSQYYQYISSLPNVDQGFFHNQFYNARMQETKDAIGWKLYSALSSDAFRQMFSAKTNSFDADAAMRDKKVVLVKGSRNALGEEGMEVFLQFIVAQFFSAALRRERMHPDHRMLCILLCDEAHHIFNSQTANILTEARKYGLALVQSTQVVQQIPEDVKAAIYGATAIKIAGPVSHTDASILAREMYCTTEFIRSMQARERESADWAFYVSGTTRGRAVKVTVPYGQLEKMPKQKGGPASAVPPSPPVIDKKPTPAPSNTGLPSSVPQTKEPQVSDDPDYIPPEYRDKKEKW